MNLSIFAGNNEPVSKTRMITGKVIDGQTGEVLAGVKVQVTGTDSYCYTDLEGNYTLVVQAKADTQLSVNMVGYRKLSVKSSELGGEAELALSPR